MHQGYSPLLLNNPEGLDDVAVPGAGGEYLGCHIPHATLHGIAAQGPVPHPGVSETTLASIRSYLALSQQPVG